MCKAIKQRLKFEDLLKQSEEVGLDMKSEMSAQCLFFKFLIVQKKTQTSAKQLSKKKSANCYNITENKNNRSHIKLLLLLPVAPAAVNNKIFYISRQGMETIQKFTCLASKNCHQTQYFKTIFKAFIRNE